MRRSLRSFRSRHYDNLAARENNGKDVSGFNAPYRLWSWRQNELFRNIHEAQYDHLQKLYRRQWYDAFRANADEYIYKFNITKSAQIAQWEAEVHQQEKERLKAKQLSDARKAMKEKHMDVLRDYHERHFFHWYERASERLQAMSKMDFVLPENINNHIEKELDKYVSPQFLPKTPEGKDQRATKQYPLNFIGQMPVLEDNDGNMSEVPESFFSQHEALLGFKANQHVTAYSSPSTFHEEEALMQEVSSAPSDIKLERLQANVLDEMARGNEKDETADDLEAPVDNIQQTDLLKHKARTTLGAKLFHKPAAKKDLQERVNNLSMQKGAKSKVRKVFKKKKKTTPKKK